MTIEPTERRRSRLALRQHLAPGAWAKCRRRRGGRLAELRFVRRFRTPLEQELST
jgi:hypothetical protein